MERGLLSDHDFRQLFVGHTISQIGIQINLLCPKSAESSTQSLSAQSTFP